MVHLTLWHLVAITFIAYVAGLSSGALGIRWILGDYLTNFFLKATKLKDSMQLERKTLKEKDLQIKSILDTVDRTYQASRLERMEGLLPKIWKLMTELNQNLKLYQGVNHQGYAKVAKEKFDELEVNLIKVDDLIRTSYKEVSNLRKI